MPHLDATPVTESRPISQNPREWSTVGDNQTVAALVSQHVSDGQPKGEKVFLKAGDRLDWHFLDQHGLHDEISAVKVREGFVLQAWRDQDQGHPAGPATEWVGPAEEYVGDAWNDEISHLVVRRTAPVDGGTDGTTAPAPEPEPQPEPDEDTSDGGDGGGNGDGDGGDGGGNGDGDGGDGGGNGDGDGGGPMTANMTTIVLIVLALAFLGGGGGALGSG